MFTPRKEMAPPAGGIVDIEIECDRPVSHPYYAQYRKNQPLRWRFPQGYWSIHFLDKRTPIPGVFDIYGHGNETFGDPKFPQVDEGHYRYAVAAIPDGKETRDNRIYIDATCPEIIIG